jgi:hypothetical protein
LEGKGDRGIFQAMRCGQPQKPAGHQPDIGAMYLRVNRPILHQSIAIVQDQIGVDFDTLSIKLVWLQVDFSNQKTKSRCEKATGGFSASVNLFPAPKMQS